MKKLKAIREDYNRLQLKKSQLSKDPLKMFKKWMKASIKNKVQEPTAFTLSTVDGKGRPCSRIVLLKGFDDRGFHFYTNYGSNKADQLKNNPNVSMNFFWREMHRQVRIEGRVKKMSRKETKAYFSQRPRMSQIGAWTSSQSDILTDRKTLSTRMRLFIKRFKGVENIPCPKFWGGYIIEPRAIEFWQGRQSRLHDRFQYKKIKKNWVINRLWP